MKSTTNTLLFVVLFLSAALGLQEVSAGITAAQLQQIKLPDGFRISIFADDVPGARSMALAENGVVFVGSQKGNVYAVQDSNGDGKADMRYQIASGLYLPNGVAYQAGTLYVAEVNRIIRFENIVQQLQNPPEAQVVYDQFPDKKHHGWKYLRFGPDQRLYTAVGAPCNICDPQKTIFTSLVRLNTDGSGMEIIARGIRNTVGFDWQPATNHLYFSDNGRDHLGDDVPPDELNKWNRKGSHYGYPYCHGGDILDPELGNGKACDEFIAPEWKFKAHMAALGLRFYRGKQFPSAYHQQLFVAQHGSWNRSEPHGYRVAVIKFKQHKAASEQVFAEGWLRDNGEVWGRPVDILEMPDGSLLVSDDHANVIYKIETTK
jgi:glucose/arabinose dehydrogenase